MLLQLDDTPPGAVSSPAPSPVEAAMAGVRAGDPSALKALYDLTSARLHAVCLRLLRDRTEAEEALQDVYLAVWRTAARFDPERGEVLAWLATIARNRAIDRLRGRLRRPQEAIDRAMHVPDPAPDAHAHLVADEEARRLHACLEGLDLRTSTAIRTAFLEGATYEALARQAGVPLGTMKSCIRRGLISLRAALGDEARSEGAVGPSPIYRSAGASGGGRIS